MLRALLISLSESHFLRTLAEESSLGRRVSTRFVAGTEIEDVLRATELINQKGATVSIDNLGENVSQAEQARASAQIYHSLLDTLSSRGLQANISLKLTHMGLDVDEALAYQLVSGLVAKAATLKNFVRVDMEGSAYTQRTLDFVRQMHRVPGHQGAVGTVIQSYLYRSENDVKNLVAAGIRIRLCKGAYKEPPEIAFQRKADVDANYVQLMKILLTSGIFHGLATHDERIINQAKRFATQQKIGPESFEFQMLHGIRRDLQQRLVHQGWRMRVYIPFGTEWYPYFMRRLAERPANVFFMLRNLLRA
ncbi:MAG: proline dehydrogenase family protein [Acidobacteria bacterium]|nr:proline dehydrogenase family protein [Acidobacteriota bacterium]